ncbi:MAG: LD-carboxypeptidase [Deltaproteobacteria bacterium]|jgi:muramoyltetrapeptide carboxypeptidase|nr:LD-carboxypeptidase [Deltaproteobacteria bacterium]
MSPSLFLQPGALIGLFAPASPTPKDQIKKAALWVKEMGFTPFNPFDPPKSRGYLAGSDVERLEECLNLMAHPKIEALLAVRGGYGSTRLLKSLAPLWSTFPDKPIIGFSDITALHLARLAATGVGGWHGPTLVNLVDPKRRQGLKNALLGQNKPWNFSKYAIIQKGQAKGRLIGGNLSLLVSLLGSPYWPNSKGAILLLEDHNEELYRLDRLLTALRLSGRLAGLKGLIFGDFGESVSLNALKPLLWETAKECPGPVVRAPYFGHGRMNRPWPFGGLGELSATEAGGRLTFKL